MKKKKTKKKKKKKKKNDVHILVHVCSPQYNVYVVFFFFFFFFHTSMKWIQSTVNEINKINKE